MADYGTIGSSMDNALPTRTYGVQVRVPVFDGGRRDARRAESESQYRQERTRTRDLREQVELESPARARCVAVRRMNRCRWH